MFCAVWELGFNINEGSLIELSLIDIQVITKSGISLDQIIDEEGLDKLTY